MIRKPSEHLIFTIWNKKKNWCLAKIHQKGKHCFLLDLYCFDFQMNKLLVKLIVRHAQVLYKKFNSSSMTCSLAKLRFCIVFSFTWLYQLIFTSSEMTEGIHKRNLTNMSNVCCWLWCSRLQRSSKSATPEPNVICLSSLISPLCKQQEKGAL